MASGQLLTETPLQFSAELAAAIGLEGAVLIQQLKTVYKHQPATHRDDLAWLHLSHAYLLELMPFWDRSALLSICDVLVDVGLLRLDRTRAADDCLLLAIVSTEPVKAPARAPREGETAAKPRPTAQRRGAETSSTRRTMKPASSQGEPLPRDFSPSEDMLELLERFHGVPRGFALAQLEDFTLYWRERGSAGHAWQNRFKQHVQWHWKRHQQELAGVEHGGDQGTGRARRTRDSSLEQDLSDTTWAD